MALEHQRQVSRVGWLVVGVGCLAAAALLVVRTSTGTSMTLREAVEGTHPARWEPLFKADRPSPNPNAISVSFNVVALEGDDHLDGKPVEAGPVCGGVALGWIVDLDGFSPGSPELNIVLRGDETSTLSALVLSLNEPQLMFEELRAGIVAPQQRPDGQPHPPIRPRAVGLLTGGAYGPAWNEPVPPESDTMPQADQRSTELPDRDELVVLAAAFGRLPALWQAVLWHRWVERAPAAELTAILGRPAADVVTLEQTAHRGLVDAYAEVTLGADPGPDPLCVPVIPQLGAYRRGTLPDTQRRVVDAQLSGSGSPPSALPVLSESATLPA